MAWNYNKAAGAAAPALAPAAAALAPAAAAPAPLPTPAPAVNHAPPAPTPLPAALAPVAPAALPTYQAPAPVAPAPVAPAPAAPRKPRGRPAAAAAPQAPVAPIPGQTTIPMAAAPAPAAALPAVQAFSGFLGVIVPSTPQARTLTSAIVNGQTAAGEPNIFPTLDLLGGTSGGMLDLNEMNQEGSDDDLQVGRKPIYGVLLGYRLLMVLWPQAYKEGQAKQRPRSQGSLPSTEAEAGDIVQAAAQRYTFRNRVDEAKYDPYGHPSVILELFAFEEKAGLFCVRTSGTYDSMLETSKFVNTAFPNGQIQPTPVKIEPVTEPRQSKQRVWNEHYLQVTQHIGAETAPAREAFNRFYQDAGNDPDLTAAMQEWNKMTITPEQIEALRQIASI